MDYKPGCVLMIDYNPGCMLISKKTFAFKIPASLKWIYTDILDFAVHFHG